MRWRSVSDGGARARLKFNEEAERLEHFISERFEDRVAAILGDPLIDPHGHPIPPKYEAGVYRGEVPLLDWPVRTPTTISSVSDRSAAALRELERLGLVPGAALIVEQKTPAASIAIRLSEDRNIFRVSNDLAKCILVASSGTVRTPEANLRTD